MFCFLHCLYAIHIVTLPKITTCLFLVDKIASSHAQFCGNQIAWDIVPYMFNTYALISVEANTRQETHTHTHRSGSTARPKIYVGQLSRFISCEILNTFSMLFAFRMHLRNGRVALLSWYTRFICICILICIFDRLFRSRQLLRMRARCCPLVKWVAAAGACNDEAYAARIKTGSCRLSRSVWRATFRRTRNPVQCRTAAGWYRDTVFSVASGASFSSSSRELAEISCGLIYISAYSLPLPRFASFGDSRCGRCVSHSQKFCIFWLKLN